MVQWDRLQFDGHEKGYLRAFQGLPPDPSPSAVPALTSFYQLLGTVTQDPRALTIFSAIVGAMGVLGVAMAAQKYFGSKVALWSALFVSILGEHVAWSTSSYNVILPNTLMIWAFATDGWRSAFLIGGACLFRGELALIGLLRGLPGIGGLTIFLGPFDPTLPSDPKVAFLINLPMVRYLGPPVLLLGLFALIGRRAILKADADNKSQRVMPSKLQRDQAAWSLLLCIAWIHLVGCLFDDYGSRHALLGGVASATLVGIAAARWSSLIGIVACIGFLVDTHQIAESWYARPDIEDVDELQLVRNATQLGCVEVTEEPPIAGQKLDSHFRVMTDELSEPCFVWGEESVHRQWSSRGLRDRAFRMRTLYELSAIGYTHVPGGVRVYHLLQPRWQIPKASFP